MFAKALVLLPLLAAVATAQSKDGFEPLPDGVVVDTAELQVVSYGSQAREGAMSLNITAAVAGEVASIVVNGGRPGAAMTLLFGFSEASIDLAPLGLDGKLLVGEVAFTASVRLDAAGSFTAQFDRTNPALAGKKIYVQAATVEEHDCGLELRLSHGLAFQFGTAPRSLAPRPYVTEIEEMEVIEPIID